MTGPFTHSVLYVDDDALNLRVFEANFGRRLPIILCASPAEALGVLEQRRAQIGVVLSDQRMPGMTGVELLERARSLAPEARRMLVTAYADMQAVIDAVNRGQVTRYFVKPWDRADLLSALEEGLRMATLEQRVREVEGRMLQAERLATLGQVTAGIAHELGAPVSYMSQNVASLRRDLGTLLAHVGPSLQKDPALRDIASDLPDLLRDLEQGTQHLRRVADSLKAQARGEDAEQSSEVSEVSDFVARLARPQLRERARLSTQGDPVHVRCGPVRLTQILLNLVVNAAQAMEGTGRAGRIELRWLAREQDVQLTVVDNGCGIPVDLQEKVFQPLFTTKPVGVGTGLGLAICRDLVGQLGGALTLQSVPGEGTRVDVTLPRAPAP
ncbi:response regulator [Aggregicoccus sp. 17bor-14]|uniref:sensor histidine kinase n=1 Tax=Myxococcaceae TaxID=31 RepID=UPI00129D0C73|nr:MULTISPECIES: hybrid sensor histidine kinase/response regulator [Myxococcaceae]MBF5041420.1 response regulator [Simulacricoccus sp. 17bor-14]MRI87204.1 response regulator [Aggregicoccus sp. 17bor-14]